MRLLLNLLNNPWLWRGLALFSLAFFAFIYGFIAAELHWWPYQSMNQAVVAFDALAETASTPSIDGLRVYRQAVDRPTVNKFAPRPESDFFLVSGGANGYISENHTEGCMAWIIDRTGQTVHAWPNHPELWNDARLVKRVPGISGAANATGIHLFDNGDLLATFHGQNTYPFAIGIAKFNRDGQLKWKKELLTHHFFSVDEEGHIFVPALEAVDPPVQIGNTDAYLTHETGKIYIDYVLELDPDGRELDRISVLDCLCRSGWQGQLIRGNSMHVVTDDPLHLNDVRVITAEQAVGMPGITAGDLLVSMRNINSLAIIDRRTKLMKWFSSGSTVGQHAPRVYKDGILVLDNLGGDVSLGGTRLVHIDFLTHQPQCLFPRSSSDMPDLCRTVNCGHLDLHTDGQHALMAVTHGGSIWEIDLSTGKVVWEYIINDGRVPNTRGKIGYASYLTRPAFLND